VTCGVLRIATAKFRAANVPRRLHACLCVAWTGTGCEVHDAGSIPCPNYSLNCRSRISLTMPTSCAHPDANGGWDVTTNVDGREIGSDHCGDWHRFERYRARMQRWLTPLIPP
jgi:hypothetical protein